MASGLQFPVCVSEELKRAGRGRWTRHDKWAMKWRKHWIRHRFSIARVLQSLFSIDTQHKVRQHRNFIRLHTVSMFTYTFCKSSLNGALSSCVTVLGTDICSWWLLSWSVRTSKVSSWHYLVKPQSTRKRQAVPVDDWNWEEMDMDSPLPQ